MRHKLSLSLLAMAGIFLANSGPATAATFESVGLYQSFNEMMVWARAFEAANPDIVEVVKFGNSHQGRPLLAIQISTTPGQNNPDKPEFLFTGGVHAREVVGSEAVYRLAEHLVGSYRSGSAAIDILAEREVWIVPTLNPDGRVIVENGYSRQRKNMEYFDGQSLDPSRYTRGVDLNRNFSHRWTDASSTVTTETFRGSGPLSAPEASTLWWDLLHNESYFSDMLAAIDFHSGISSILTPWISSASSPNSYPMPQEDREKFEFLAGEMSKSEITGFPVNDLSYNAYGTLTDSLYEEFDTYALCVELYKGNPYDYFSLFNPVNELVLGWTIEKAINSSMFLLSDQAFSMVPEPSTWLLTLLAMAWLLSLRRRPHIL
ncbi:MAG: M14 family zinc carboxypeptidase [Planctomycetota bacterium]|nr:M14 family zinc carboxypeptidase [Planctomycetota bacterium]